MLYWSRLSKLSFLFGSSNFDQAYGGITSAIASQAIQNNATEHLSAALRDILSNQKYAIPAEKYDLASSLGLAPSRLAYASHSHPIHANFRRMQVLREIPRLIKSPCTILQMKSELFADFSRVVRQPVFLRNVILSNRDYHRYTEDSLTPSKLALDPIETHSAFLHDAFHYFSPADVLALFRHSPKLGVLIGTAIIPFESVYQDFSAQPELYRFAVKGDQLLYTPEGDNYNCYSQPLEARKWLLTSRLVDSSTGEVFTVEVVDQRGPFVSISVTRSLLLSPPMRSFVNEGMIVLPQVFRRKLYAQRFVPVKLFRSLYFYGRNITTMKPKDLYAKLRQHSGFLTSETLPSDLAEYLIMVVIALLEHEVGFSGLERLYYSGFSGLIRHYTIGWLKSHTVDRFRRMV